MSSPRSPRPFGTAGKLSIPMIATLKFQPPTILCFGRSSHHRSQLRGFQSTQSWVGVVTAVPKRFRRGVIPHHRSKRVSRGAEAPSEVPSHSHLRPRIPFLFHNSFPNHLLSCGPTLLRILGILGFMGINSMGTSGYLSLVLGRWWDGGVEANTNPSPTTVGATQLACS